MAQKKKKRSITFMNMILTALLLFLGFKINDKTDWISKIPYKQALKLANWFPYERWINQDILPVSSPIMYQNLVDDMYITDSNQVKLISDGIVLSHDEQSVLILQDNGIEVKYSHMNQVVVKDDERLYEGSLLGTYEDFVMLEFMKDNEKMDYESARILP